MLSEQQQRIMGYFIEEAKDHLNTIEQGLLNLQATIKDPEMANEVFRAAHSVKGGAAMLGLTSIQNTSHRLEDYFKVLKECPIKIDQKLETLLLRVYDTLQELVEQLQGPFGLTDDKAGEAMSAVEPTFTELNQHLSHLVRQAGAQTPEDVDLAVAAVVPSPVVAKPSPLRVTTEESALRFIFQNDVPARLREMLQIFKQIDTLATRQQLYSLCQTLAQSGEQLDLSDWCQLLDATARAVVNPDNTYRTLAPVVIKEIKRAQEQILAGNLTQISASEDLLALVPPEPFPVTAEVTDTDLADLLGSVDLEDPDELVFSEAPLVDEIGSDEFDQFATPSDSPEAASNSDDLDFLAFDPPAEESDGDNELDLSLIDQLDETIPALSNTQAGPEVGIAELNSLADLFEGEEPDLGFVWQEEIVDESVENTPEALELNDSPSDFSDLLFQDSEALVLDELDESDEDLSGLLNNSAQQVQASAEILIVDEFTFGADSAEGNPEDLDQELIFLELNPPSESADPVFSLPSEDVLEIELGLAEVTPKSEVTPEFADLPNLDALFSGNPDTAPQDVMAPSTLDAETVSFDALFGDDLADQADSSPDDFESGDELEPLNLSFAAPSESANAETDLPLQMADASGAVDDDTRELFDLDFELTSSASPANSELWQPEAVADPWSEGSDIFQSEADTATSNEVNELDSSAADDLFILSADEETDSDPRAASDLNWMDLTLSEPSNQLNQLNSELDLGSAEPSAPLDSTELSFELDSSELAALNQPSLELTADEADDLDFNFDETAEGADFNFDALLNSPEADADADLFDQAAIAPVAAETTFHFGTPTDSVEADLELDDLDNQFGSIDLEADLLNETDVAADSIFAAPSSDLEDLEIDLNEDFGISENLTDAGLEAASSETADSQTADISEDGASDQLDAAIEPSLSAEPLSDRFADSAELDDLNLDEFALSDDFSEVDVGATNLSEADALDALLEEPSNNANLSDLFAADLTTSAIEFDLPETSAEFDAPLEFSSLDAAIEGSTADNPFGDEALGDLFEPESELEPPANPDDLDTLDLFETNLFEATPPQASVSEINLAQDEDSDWFDSELSPSFAAEIPASSETASADLSDFDLDSSALDFSAEPTDLASAADISESLIDLESTPLSESAAGLDSLDLENLDLENLEPNDGSNDTTTEQSLDAAFNVDGAADENLLEFELDNRVDSASDDDLAEGLFLIDDPDVPLEASTDSEPSQPASELADDFSLDFDSASPEANQTEADLASLSDEIESELNFTDLEISALNELDFDADSSAGANLSEQTELDFGQDFVNTSNADASSAEESDEAALEFDLDLANFGSESTEGETAAINFNSADLNAEFDDLNNADLNNESLINLSDLDSIDLNWASVEIPPSTDLTAGDLNELNLDELLNDVPSDSSWADTEVSSNAAVFNPSLTDAAFETEEAFDVDSMLAEGSSGRMGISAEPAEFDDLEAMLAEDPLPITAINVEDVEATEPTNRLDESSIEDFADLEALLDDAPEAEPAEPFTGPISSPPLEEDEFSDLEALLQDADQALGVGSSPNRKASTTSSRRPGRRGGLNEQTMRVTVKHLDNLNNLVGEMVVNRNSLEQAEERLRQFLDNLLYQVQQLSDVGQRMRDLYERSLLESSLLSGRRGSSMSAPVSGFGAGQTNHMAGMSFDALEMDRFTGFHVLSQEMIELIVRVRESASDIDFVVEETDQVTRNFRQITTQLQEGLTRSRMVPFSQTADRLPRGVRDNSLKYGKQAELLIEGRDTLIDKMIVEQLYDPMTHLVNNAVAHGIETPEERIAAGKPPTGQIIIRTFHQGNQTVISVSDDGAGINPEKVRAKALAKGLINAAQAREMTRLDTYDLLFNHGFSTVDQIDDLRGRGVGLDVVRNNLNEIRGAITIDSTIGKGTTFTIRLPLTLSISKALCCISNRARIAFPMDGVEDMLDVPKERIQTDEQGRSCIQWRDTVLPFQPLSDLLRYNRVLGRGSVYGGNQEEDVISIVVLRSAGNYLALQVDQVLGEQEIVIKQLEGPAPKPLGVAGATVLGDGRIMPIADVLELIDLWQGRIRREAGGSLWDKGEALPPEPPAKTESTVLIVDDSITVRELLSMTFSKVGYRVEQARDGQEAWEKLRAGLPCDLVFCDIEMPRMDGLELLSRIQKDANLSHLPIAMLTSRGADRHRQMAVQLGAKGYFTKPYLEEMLLDAAQRMLKGEVMIPGVNTQ